MCRWGGTRPSGPAPCPGDHPEALLKVAHQPRLICHRHRRLKMFKAKLHVLAPQYLFLHAPCFGKCPRQDFQSHKTEEIGQLCHPQGQTESPETGTFWKTKLRPVARAETLILLSLTSRVSPLLTPLKAGPHHTWAEGAAALGELEWAACSRGPANAAQQDTGSRTSSEQHTAISTGPHQRPKPNIQYKTQD